MWVDVGLRMPVQGQERRAEADQCGAIQYITPAIQMGLCPWEWEAEGSHCLY